MAKIQSRQLKSVVQCRPTSFHLLADSLGHLVLLTVSTEAVLCPLSGLDHFHVCKHRLVLVVDLAPEEVVVMDGVMDLLEDHGIIIPYLQCLLL